MSRILMTADAVGGVWTHAVDLARALTQAGDEVLLAVEGPPPRPAQRARLGSVRMVALGGRLEWMPEPEADLERNGRRLLALARRFRPEVVHLAGYAHAPLPWPAPVLVVAHSCVRTWWRAVHGGEPPTEAWGRYLARVRQGLAAADVVVAPTHAFLEEVRALYRPGAPCLVIANGRDPSGFRPAAKEPFVLAAGRLWDEAKNLAAVTAAARGLPWPVYVAGPGGQDADGVRPLGPLSSAAIADWLGRAAVFAAPARYEPFGLTAVEAALSGCALVLGDLATQREIWGDAALYVPPEDHDALRAALTALLGDEARRRRLARRASAIARSLTPAAMAEGYRAAYARLRPAPNIGRPCDSSSSAIP